MIYNGFIKSIKYNDKGHHSYDNLIFIVHNKIPHVEVNKDILHCGHF